MIREARIYRSTLAATLEAAMNTQDRTFQKRARLLAEIEAHYSKPRVHFSSQEV